MAVNVLRMLRTGTAAEHAQVERVLDLLDPELDRGRLASVLGLLHGVWRAAEGGLDAWAADFPADARAVDWARRRRARLFAWGRAALGARAAAERPRIPAVKGTN